MGWIAISPLGEDQDGGASLRRARSTLRDRLAKSAILPRGTLMIEARIAGAGRPVTLFSVDHTHPWHGALRLTISPGKSVSLVQTQGTETRHAIQPIPQGQRGELIRLTMVWDAPARLARLWLEWPEDDQSPVMAEMADPIPVPGDALSLPILTNDAKALAPELSFAALSDDIEPIGPMPGLAGSLPLATPNGPRLVSEIAPGDPVVSVCAGQAPQTTQVLAVTKRNLPARGSFRPVHLRAPYFGLLADVTMAANQRLVLAGSDVEYLFEQEKVLVPVRHLISDRKAQYVNGPDTISWSQFLLPEQQELMVAGIPVESLHVGRLRRDPEAHAAGLLAHVTRRALPHHAATLYPVLKAFEATSLTSLRQV